MGLCRENGRRRCPWHVHAVHDPSLRWTSSDDRGQGNRVPCPARTPDAAPPNAWHSSARAFLVPVLTPPPPPAPRVLARCGSCKARLWHSKQPPPGTSPSLSCTPPLHVCIGAQWDAYSAPDPSSPPPPLPVGAQDHDRPEQAPHCGQPLFNGGGGVPQLLPPKAGSRALGAGTGHRRVVPYLRQSARCGDVQCSEPAPSPSPARHTTRTAGGAAVRSTGPQPLDGAPPPPPSEQRSAPSVRSGNPKTRRACACAHARYALRTRPLPRGMGYTHKSSPGLFSGPRRFIPRSPAPSLLPCPWQWRRGARGDGCRGWRVA